MTDGRPVCGTRKRRKVAEVKSSKRSSLFVVVSDCSPWMLLLAVTRRSAPSDRSLIGSKKNNAGEAAGVPGKRNLDRVLFSSNEKEEEVLTQRTPAQQIHAE